MRSGTLFWGFVLIVAGGLLLLNNLGILAVNIWDVMWPLFLIALGVWILWGTVFRRSAQAEHAAIPLDGAARARIRVHHGAGRLDIGPGAGNGNLVEGEFGGGLDKKLRRDGDLLDATLSVPVQVFPFFWGPGYNLDWTFRLARAVPVALNLETGANESRLDLTGLMVTDLSLKSGASSTTVDLPAEAGFTRVRIETGAAAVNVNVPANVAARIRAHGGLSSINVDSNRFSRMGDIYQSPDYETAANKVEMDIETGVGSADVR
jgi:hypothetical protein